MTEGGASIANIRKRRLSAHGLPRLFMPIEPCFNTAPPTCDVTLLQRRGSAAHSYNPVEEQGRELFEHFVHDELMNVGIEAPQQCFTPIITTPIGYGNPMWAKTGMELRNMADEFAKTNERAKLKEQASKVSIARVTYEKFRDLLSELFYGGKMTKERIMVLFFYCSDIAIRCLRENESFAIFQKFLSWSIKYITEHVCAWVERNGGWGAILYKGSKNVAQFFVTTGACILVTYFMYRVVRRCVSS